MAAQLAAIDAVAWDAYHDHRKRTRKAGDGFADPVNGGSRSEHTCPGEPSRSFRLAADAADEPRAAAVTSTCSICRTSRASTAEPTTTHGKNAAKAKAIELAGWSYPRHLAGRAFAVFVHGDTAGAESLRRNLTDTLSDMRLEGATGADRYIGYDEPYATSHDALDKDTALVTEVRNAMRVLVERTRQLRAGVRPLETVVDPRPK